MKGGGRCEAVCVGETMAMVTPVDPAPLETAELFTICAGGAESNVAMYLASLGHRVAWVGRLGDDPLGRRVLKDVSDAGVDTSLVELDATAPTGAYFKDPGPERTRVFYYRRESAASHMSLSQLAPILREPPPLVHLTGITPALSPACDEAMSELMVKLCTSTSAVSFDVNFREGLWSATVAAPRLKELAQQADVVFVGLDEAAALWRTRTPQSVRSLIDRPPLLVVKNGDQGATAFHETGSDFVPALKLEVCEATGAGDAFAAGWLSGWLRSLPHTKRLRLGHLLASLALGSTADHRALPNDRELKGALSLSNNEWAVLKLTARSQSRASRPLLAELEER